MIGCSFNLFDSLCIFNTELKKNRFEKLLRRNNFEYLILILRDNLILKESLEPFKFDEDPVPNECIFGEVVSQVVRLFRIPAVQRGDRCQWGHLFDFLSSQWVFLVGCRTKERVRTYRFMKWVQTVNQNQSNHFKGLSVNLEEYMIITSLVIFTRLIKITSRSG